MQDLVAALEKAGVPWWLIAAVVALAFLARPLWKLCAVLAAWVRGRPALADVVTDQLTELGRQQGAFMTRMEKRLARAEADADEARAAAAECARKHHECLEQNRDLEARVAQLERARETS